VSAETTRGQLNQIKPGMTREQVIDSLGEPAQTNLVNSAPSEDLYACDEQGQIIVVRESTLTLFVETLLIIPAAVDNLRLNHLRSRSSICAVHYDQDRVLSTSQPGVNGIVLTK
jgi:hypothetical protein